MNALDVFLAFFIATVGVLGLRSGLIRGSVTLVGLAVGLVAAGRLNERLGPLLMPWLHTLTMSNLAAFLILFFATWLFTLLLGAVVREMFYDVHLGWLDHIGGLVLGLAKGLFVAEVIVLVLMVMPIGGLRDSVLASYIGGHLARLAPDLLELVPPVLRYWRPF